MVTNNHAALLFNLESAKIKKQISTELIQSINALVMRNTGNVYHTMLGNIDAKTGAFRKGNVTAGISYFPNFDKVERLTNDLVNQLTVGMKSLLTIPEQLNLSFDAHFNLVSIHPFYDGNGRTSRLLMNYIQAFFGLPLAIVSSENKADYIEALVNTRQKENVQIFRDFMLNEYAGLLTKEIQLFEEMKKPSKGKGFTLLF